MQDNIKHLKNFVKFAANKLHLDYIPHIEFVGHEEDSKRAFGDTTGSEINVRVVGRHPDDIMRTIAHELVHLKQNQMKKRGEQMKEDEANALAGRVMRDYNLSHPDVFKLKTVEEDVASTVPANAVSGGGVEGIGFGPKGEPGGISQIMMKMLKRKKLSDIIGKNASLKELKRDK